MSGVRIQLHLHHTFDYLIRKDQESLCHEKIMRKERGRSCFILYIPYFHRLQESEDLLSGRKSSSSICTFCFELLYLLKEQFEI